MLNNQASSTQQSYSQIHQHRKLTTAGSQQSLSNSQLHETSFVSDLAHDLAQLIKAKCQHDSSLDLSPLDNLKQSTSAASKLSNWNVIGHVMDTILAKKGGEAPFIDQDTKSLLLVEDPETKAEVAEKIKRELEGIQQEQTHANVEYQTPFKVEAEQKVSVSDTGSKYASCDSSLMFILSCLVDALGLQTVKQAAAFFTNDNQFFKHACSKGLKGANFAPIQEFLRIVLQNISILLKHLETEDDTFRSVVSVFTCPLESSDDQVASRGIEIIWRLLTFANQQEARGVLLEPEKLISLEFCLDLINHKPEKIKNICQMLIQPLFEDKFSILAKKLSELDEKYREDLPDFLPFLGFENDYMALNELIGYSLKLLDGEHYNEIKVLHAAWLIEPRIMDSEHGDQKITLLDSALKIISRACREARIADKLTFIVLTFDLLEQLAKKKSPQSASLYKLLTFTFIENFSNDTIRETMSYCLIDLFNGHKTIPISILLDPLLRNYFHMVDNGQYHLDPFDCKLLYCLIHHPKMKMTGAGADVALQTTQLLAEGLCNYPKSAAFSSTLLVFMVNRFKDEEAVKSQVKTIYQTLLEKYLNNCEENWQNDSSFAQNKGSEIPNQRPMDEKLRISQGVILKVLSEVLLAYHHDSSFVETLLTDVQQAQLVYLKMFSNQNGGLQRLLTKYGITESHIILRKDSLAGASPIPQRTQSLEDMLPSFIKDSEVINNSGKYETINQNQEEKEKEMDHLMLNNDEKPPSRLDSNQSHWRVKQEAKPQSSSSQPKEDKPRQNPFEKDEQSKQAESERKPRSRENSRIRKTSVNNRKIIERIEQIQKKREEDEALKQKAEEAKKWKQERQKRNLRQQILAQNERNLGMLPPKPKLAKQVTFLTGEKSLEKKDETLKDPVVLMQQFQTLPTMVFYELEKEELRDSQAVQILLQRYQKCVKFLFGKYAMTRSQTSKVESWTDMYAQKTLNLAELTKLLRDHDIDNHIMTKNDISDLLRLVNNHTVNKNDLSELPLDYFKVYLVQLSIHLYVPKEEGPYPAVDFVGCLQKLFDHLEKSATKRGGATSMYQKQGIKSFSKEEQNTILDIEKRMKTNPKNFVMPEGYSLVKDTEIVDVYRFPSVTGVPESQVVAIEVIDQILYDALGIHFLEKVQEAQTIMRVRPLLNKKQLQPVQQSLDFEKLETNSKKRSNSQRKSLVLSPISKTSRGSRRINKFSETQEDKSTKLESSSNAETSSSRVQAPKALLPPRPDRPKNEALQRKEEQELKQKLEQDERERRFKQRQLKIKRDLSERKALKEKEEADILAKQKEEERANAEKQQRQAQLQKEQQEKRRKQIEALKQDKKLKEDEQRQNEVESLKRQVEQKQQETKQFLLKQKQKLQNDFKRQQDLKDEKLRKELETKKKAEIEAKVKKDNKQQYYSKDKENKKEIEQGEKEAVQELFCQAKITEVFARCKQEYEGIFTELLARNQKAQIGKEPEKGLNLAMFLKFCSQHGLNQNRDFNQDDQTMVFRAVVKDRPNDQAHLPNNLSFEEFQRAILRTYLVFSDQGHGDLDSEQPRKSQANNFHLRSLASVKRFEDYEFNSFLTKLKNKNLTGYRSRSLGGKHLSSVRSSRQWQQDESKERSNSKEQQVFTTGRQSIGGMSPRTQRQAESTKIDESMNKVKVLDQSVTMTPALKASAVIDYDSKPVFVKPPGLPSRAENRSRLQSAVVPKGESQLESSMSQSKIEDSGNALENGSQKSNQE